ncbi:MAG: hypothetical protein ABJC39_07685 [Chloroflexota bacterium]
MTSTIGRFQGRRACLAVLVALVATACATGQVAPSPSPASPSVAPVTAAPSASPTPSPPVTPTPPPATPPPNALPIGDLTAGATYSLAVGCDASRCWYVTENGQELLVTVPARGWLAIDTWFLGKDNMDPEGYDMTLLPYTIGNVYADPCQWRGIGHRIIAVGPTVDDLANALVAQEGPGAKPAAAVTVGGYPGKRVELTIPDDVDTKTCDEGDFGRWSPINDPSHYGPFTYGNGQHDTVYIVDVGGTRWVIDTNYLPGTSPANIAELKALVASIRFDS